MTKKQNKPKAVQVKPAKKKTIIEEIAELKSENVEVKARVKALEDATGIAGPAGAKGEKGEKGAQGEQGDAGAGFWGKAGKEKVD